MKQTRLALAALFSAPLLALAACGGEEPAPSAAAPSATAAGPTAAPSDAPSTAPSDSAAAPGTATGGGDRKICTSANRAGEAMRDEFIAAMQAGGGEPAPAKLKQILGDFDEKLTTLAESGADTAVTAAVKRMAGEAAKAAAAASPLDAASDLGFEEAGADVTAACKAAGVKVNF